MRQPETLNPDSRNPLSLSIWKVIMADTVYSTIKQVHESLLHVGRDKV